MVWYALHNTPYIEASLDFFKFVLRVEKQNNLQQKRIMHLIFLQKIQFRR